MIYTSYFGNLKKLPDNIIPISICGKAPDWYTGLQYKKLAPKYGFFMEWKKNNDNDYYIKRFNELVLDNLEAHNVIKELNNLAMTFINKLPENDNRRKYFEIALICYEKPSDFCHRHLVSYWFNKNGITCDEYII